MRARFFVLCVSAALFVAPLAVQACSTSEGSADGVADAPESGVRETRPVELPDAEPPCDPKADLLRKVRDASIGDGASTTGICLGCARAKCAEAIASCTEDCPCQAIVGRSIECYLTTQQIGCAIDLTDYLVTPKTRKYALALLGCVQSECPQECSVEDAGVEPSPDAATSPDTGSAVDSGEG
jgi:hypothetical protein